MLYLAGDTFKPKRIQGIFISESEVQKIVKYIIENNKNYEAIIEESMDFEKELEKQMQEISLNESVGSDFEMDELYPEAYKLVVSSGKASASFLQRRLRVGYARAARLLDLLEERGVIGPGEGAKPREVLIKSDANTADIAEEEYKDEIDVSDETNEEVEE